MMSELIEKKVTGDPVQVKTEDGRPSLYTENGALTDSLRRSEEKYKLARADYFNALADEPILLAKTTRWQRAAKDLIQWAETLFNADQEDDDARNLALDIMEKVAKEAEIRHRNTWMHADIMLKQSPNDLNLQKRLDDAEFATGYFLRCSLKTQMTYISLYEKGEVLSGDLKKEARVSARVAEFREKIFPRDHVYVPARIFPPHPVPKGERVPETPRQYTLYKSQPVDAYEFDRETDEVLLKKDYISPDGLIDRNSLVYDFENETVTMKFRGGEPIVWKVWKAKNTGDMPEEGSWVLEYLRRHYIQLEEDDIRKLAIPIWDS